MIVIGTILYEYLNVYCIEVGQCNESIIRRREHRGVNLPKKQ